MASISKPSPQKTRRPRKWLLLAALIILIAAGGGTGYYFWKKQATPVTSQSSTLQTATVTRGNIKLFASGTGTLVAPTQATFGFRTSGQVVDVLVKVGDVVESGQLLARLDDASAQQTYQQALRALKELTSPAALATAQLAVADDKVNVATTRSTLAYLISPDVVYWEEQVAADEKALQQAKDDAAAAQPSPDAVKKVQTAETTLRVAKYSLAQAWLDYWNDYVPATFLTVTKNGRDVTKQVIPPSDADVAKARANYALAQSTLAEDQDYLNALTTGTIPENATGSKIADLQQSQQAVETAKDNLDATNLYAPIHGTILALGFAVGDTAGSSSTVNIANLDQPYTVEIFLDQSDWGNIQVGYPVEVTFDLLPDNVYTGKVISIDPELSNTNGSLYIHAYVLLDSNVKTVLPFGTSASVDIIGGEATNVLLVPIEALHEISPGQYSVFVMVSGKPEVRMVDVGLQDATHAEIKSGLNAGDVVTTGITVTK
jgi:RND family efflux transporter MFP subunit